VRRLSARPSLRYSPPVKLTLNLYDGLKADPGGTPRLENGAHPLNTPAARREKNSMNESTGLKHFEECATGSCRISGVGRGVSALLRTSAVYAQLWSEAHPEKRAAYSRARRVKHEPRPCTECGELFVGFELCAMAADGSDVFRVTDNRRGDLFPDWQPLP
jgi:hypothetical protein